MVNEPDVSSLRFPGQVHRSTRNEAGANTGASRAHHRSVRGSGRSFAWRYSFGRVSVPVNGSARRMVVRFRCLGSAARERRLGLFSRSLSRAAPRSGGARRRKVCDVPQDLWPGLAVGVGCLSTTPGATSSAEAAQERGLDRDALAGSRLGRASCDDVSRDLRVFGSDPTSGAAVPRLVHRSTRSAGGANTGASRGQVPGSGVARVPSFRR